MTTLLKGRSSCSRIINEGRKGGMGRRLISQQTKEMTKVEWGRCRGKSRMTEVRKLTTLSWINSHV